MPMRELPRVKTVQFDGKTRYKMYREFMKWFRDNQEITILAITDEGPELDECEFPYNLRVFYEE